MFYHQPLSVRHPLIDNVTGLDRQVRSNLSTCMPPRKITKNIARKNIPLHGLQESTSRSLFRACVRDNIRYRSARRPCEQLLSPARWQNKWTLLTPNVAERSQHSHGILPVITPSARHGLFFWCALVYHRASPTRSPTAYLCRRWLFRRSRLCQRPGPWGVPRYLNLSDCRQIRSLGVPLLQSAVRITLRRKVKLDGPVPQNSLF